VTTGFSLGHPDLAAADHWIHSLDPAPELARTHLVREPYPHVAISLETTAPVPEPAPEFAAAARAAELDGAGRAVLFPGAASLVGTLTVAEVLAGSAIDRVEILGSGAAAAEARLDTRDFVRPQYRDGELVLTVMPAADGVLVPFETRDPTPCCPDHQTVRPPSTTMLAPVR
jgi:hypothetical protein